MLESWRSPPRRGMGVGRAKHTLVTKMETSGGLWVGDEPTGLAAGWEEAEKTQCMTKLRTSEPNNYKAKKKLPHQPQRGIPISEKCPSTSLSIMHSSAFACFLYPTRCQKPILARTAFAVRSALEESTLNGDYGDSESGNDTEEPHIHHGAKQGDTKKNYPASFRPAFYVICGLRVTVIILRMIVIMLRMPVIMPDTGG
ncbi:hypothetical protein B0H19DRAFT_1073971 [Mycena capillaripes]|nr:hypothetical protein B0H19DRAFT_1073971 [Mycena capillaripes]